MEIRIGVQNVGRELVYQTDEAQDAVEKKVREALEKDAKTFELTDDKGRIVIVPTKTVAYIEIGDATPRPVGFVAS